MPPAAAAGAEGSAGAGAAWLVASAGGEGEFAQDGDMDVGVEALDVFPEREVAAVGLERGAEFEQGVGGAHFLQREHVGIQRAEALADFGFRLDGFGGARGIRTLDTS